MNDSYDLETFISYVAFDDTSGIINYSTGQQPIQRMYTPADRAPGLQAQAKHSEARDNKEKTRRDSSTHKMKCDVINSTSDKARNKARKNLEVFLPELEPDILRRCNLGGFINLSSHSIGSTEIHTNLGRRRGLQT